MNAVTAQGIQTQKQFPLNGTVLIRSTDIQTISGGCYSLTFLQDTIIESIDGDLEGDYSGFTFSAGFTLPLSFTQIKLASGAILAIKN